MKILYDVLKPLESDLKTAYKCGARVPSELLRDIRVYEDFKNSKEPKKMQRYTNLSEKHKLSEREIRRIVRGMQMAV